ncbi:MAG: DUF1552 domain-containing protein [Planctomycetaceae bacterium]|nr:DUF1552 domain-containing protein [Planctomycetaceae bacterium]
MSKRVYFNTGRSLSRRTMLRGSGIALSIPWLSAMQSARAADQAPDVPRRFVALTLGLGLLSDNLNPGEAGRDYAPSLYLEPLQDLREQLTVISGASHPGVSGGHRAEASLLTANPVGSSGKAKNTISVDQYMARHLGQATRFPSLVLSSAGSSSPSYTENGAMIPAESSPARLFTQLFINDRPEEQRQQARRMAQGRSIMDLVADDAQRLSRSLGAGDRERLDNYLTSVRELERRLADNEAWANRPKPQVDAKKPIDIGNPNDFVGRQRLMCDTIRLALQTDSTRFITYHLGGSGGVVPVPGVDEGYHNLSHHGLDEEKLAQLALVELEIMKAFGDFLRGLQAVTESDESLLDRTSVFLTSNLGNASNHDNRNMPVVLAGGGFQHGQHLAFDRNRNAPLPNLFVSVLQRLGMEDDHFMSSTGTLSGLEMRG